MLRDRCPDGEKDSSSCASLHRCCAACFVVSRSVGLRSWSASSLMAKNRVITSRKRVRRRKMDLRTFGRLGHCSMSGVFHRAAYVCVRARGGCLAVGFCARPHPRSSKVVLQPSWTWGLHVLSRRAFTCPQSSCSSLLLKKSHRTRVLVACLFRCFLLRHSSELLCAIATASALQLFLV